MTLLTPLGLLGLLGIVALIIIYIIKPNYQQKYILYMKETLVLKQQTLKNLKLKLEKTNLLH